jgi:hypothetical protein
LERGLRIRVFFFIDNAVFDSKSSAIVQCEQAYLRGGEVISRLLVPPMGGRLTLVFNS